MANTHNQPHLDRPLPVVVISEPTVRPSDFLYLPMGGEEIVGTMPDPQETHAVLSLIRHSDPRQQGIEYTTDYRARKPLSPDQLKLMGHAFSNFFRVDVSVRHPNLSDISTLDGITDAITSRTQKPVLNYEAGTPVPTALHEAGFIVSRDGGSHKVGAFISKRVLTGIHWGLEDIRLEHWERTRAYKASPKELNMQAKLIRRTSENPQSHLALKATIGVFQAIQTLGSELALPAQQEPSEAELDTSNVIDLAQRRLSSAKIAIEELIEFEEVASAS